MLTKCNSCNNYYDDEFRWTICPHNILESTPDAPYYNCGNSGYCAGHDLFNCNFTKPTLETEKVHNENSQNTN